MVGDGSENGNFLLLYALKMFLRRGVVGFKKAKSPLSNVKHQSMYLHCKMTKVLNISSTIYVI